MDDNDKPGVLKLPRFFCGALILLLGQLSYAATDNQESINDPTNAPPNIGNFALSSPQQPGPLLSFGQTLIGRNHLQLYYTTFSPYDIVPPFKNMNTSLVYGFTDKTSLYFNYPLAADSSARSVRTTNLTDITLQLEHAVYVSGNHRYQDQATLVGAITIPTSEATTPKFPKGYGAPAFFLGTTYNRTYVDWMMFVSPGALITTSSNSIRIGSQYLYQAGLGHNIIAITEKSTLFALLEFDGQYTEKTEVLKHKYPDSGGNTIALTPSLAFATQQLIINVGVGFPVVQRLFGKQAKVTHFVAANIIYTIA